MKKILLIFALLIGAFTYGQNLPINSVTFKGITTAKGATLSTTDRYPVFYDTTLGYFVKWNGSAYEPWEINDLSLNVTWANVPDANITESSVTQHEGALSITESQISDFGTYLTSLNGVTSANITDGTIAEVDIANDAVTTGKILDGSVTLSKLSIGSVASSQILDGQIDEVDLDASINASLDLADSALQSIAPGTISTTEIADNSVVNSKLAGAISPSKLNAGLGGEGQVVKIVGGVATWGADSGLQASSIDDSSELAAILTNETGTSSVVFSIAPTIVNSTLTGATMGGTLDVNSNTITNISNLTLIPTDTEPGLNEGTIYFDDSENTLKQYNGTAWEALNGSGGGSELTTVSDTGEIDLTLSTYDISGVIVAGSIDEAKLDTSVNASLDLADTAIQGTISGRTGTAATAIMFQTQAQYDADGAPSAGEGVIITDPSPEEYFIEIHLSDFATVQTASTTVPKYTWRAPYAMTLTDIRGSVATAGTTSVITMDVHDSGTTIMTTNKVTIDATEKTSTTAATLPTLTDTAIADDAELTFFIDGVDSGGTGLGYSIKLYYTK